MELILLNRSSLLDKLSQELFFSDNIYQLKCRRNLEGLSYGPADCMSRFSYLYLTFSCG